MIIIEKCVKGDQNLTQESFDILFQPIKIIETLKSCEIL